VSTGLDYPGARPFQRTDSGRFFGRAAEAAELREVWQRNQLTFMYGPAGIGKTSLLAAGVLPLIEGNNVDLLPVGGFSKGSSYPVAAPGEHTPYTLALLRSWSTPGTVSQLRRLTVDEFVARRTEFRDPAVLLLAAIDQADDLFAGPQSRQQQRWRFLRELQDALQEPSLRLLISVRDEALPQFTEAIGRGAQFRLNALEPEQACRAVEGPGLFEPTAARDLVEAVRTSRMVTAEGSRRRVVADRIEPALLQVACAGLWESLRPRSGAIRQRDLRRRGDVDAALSIYCGETIAAVADIHDIPAAWLRLWLIRTFITDIGFLEAAGEGVAEGAGLPPTVARGLEDRYLLRSLAGQPVSSRLYQLISDRIVEPLRHARDDMTPAEDAGEYLLAAERALIAGELDLAERYAAKAREAAPQTALRLHAQADSLLGNLAYEKGDLDQAVAHYRNAASLFEAAREHGSVALLLAATGRTLAARGDLLAAINELHAAVLRMPADGIIQTELSAAVQELAWRLATGDRGPSISPG
jgi:tetratricopeptide (TPR) repeat protein